VRGNVRNTIQVVGWNTTNAAATGTYPNALSSPWVRSATYGRATTSGNFGGARTVTMSAGVRF